MPSQAQSNFLCISLAISFSFVQVHHHSGSSAAGLIYPLGIVGGHKNVFYFNFLKIRIKNEPSNNDYISLYVNAVMTYNF